MSSSEEIPGASVSVDNITSPQALAISSTVTKEEASTSGNQVVSSSSSTKKEENLAGSQFSIANIYARCHRGFRNNVVSDINGKAIFCDLHKNATRGDKVMAAMAQKTQKLAATQQAARSKGKFSRMRITKRNTEQKRLTGAALEAGRRRVEANMKNYKAPPTMRPVAPNFIQALTGGHKINRRKRSPVDVARINTSRTFDSKANGNVTTRRRQLSSCSSSSADSELLALLSPTRKHAREDSSDDGDNEASVSDDSDDSSDTSDAAASFRQQPVSAKDYKGDFLSRRIAKKKQHIAKKQRRT